MRAAHTLALFLPVIIALPALAASPLEAALNAPSEGPVYAYDMAYENDDFTARGRVDPSRPEGKRINVTSPPKTEWNDELREAVTEMEADAKGDIWCKDFGDIVPADAEMVSQTDSTATYHFTPQAEKDSPEDAKMFKHLTGQVIVDKVTPGIIKFTMSAPKPFKPAIIAKIKSFKMQVSCAAAPDGRRYVERMEMNISGSAVMQKFDERVVQSISNLASVDK